LIHREGAAITFGLFAAYPSSAFVWSCAGRLLELRTARAPVRGASHSSIAELRDGKPPLDRVVWIELDLTPFGVP